MRSSDAILIARHAEVLVTMDGQRRELRDGALVARNGVVEWVGRDVWHGHCVKLDPEGIRLFARTGTGVVHCPCSNMRLASGIAPVRAMRAAGVPVGLGMDGSASNDAAHLLGAARQALLLQRVGFGPAALGACEAMEIATLGGARVPGRDDIGAPAPGMSADFVAFDLMPHLERHRELALELARTARGSH